MHTHTGTRPVATVCFYGIEKEILAELACIEFSTEKTKSDAQKAEIIFSEAKHKLYKEKKQHMADESPPNKRQRVKKAWYASSARSPLVRFADG